MKFQNKTPFIQQVNLISAEPLSVKPGDIAEFTKLQIYDFELKRIQQIFSEIPENIPSVSAGKKPQVMEPEPELNSKNKTEVVS